jgi:iron complex outermembrane receptor protein
MVLGTVNGREAASPEPGRAIRYEQYPSELVSAAEVYKTQSADLVEGGIAGTINLKTISPLSHNGPTATLRVGLQHNESGEDIPDYDPLGNRMSAAFVHQFSDTFGVAIGASTQTQKNAYGSLQGWGYSDGAWDLDGQGSIGNTPWGVAAEVKKLDTDRDGVMATFEWQASDALNVKYDVLYTKFAMDEQQNQTWAQDIGLNPGPWSGWGIEDFDGDGRPDNLLSNVVMQGDKAVAATLNGWEGQIRHVIAAYQQENSGITQGLKFSHSGFENWQIDVDLSHSTAERKNYWTAIYLDQYAETWNYDTRGRPSITAPANSPLLTPETASYNWIDNVNEGSTLEDELQSAQFDIRHDLHAGHLRALTFGARTADREKEVIWSDFVMNRSVDNGEVVAFPQDFLSSYTLGAFDTIPFLNASSHKKTAEIIYGGVAFNTAAVNESRYWKVDEQNNAVYVKLDFEGQLGSLDYNANIGVRQVEITTKSYAMDGQFVKNDFSKALPSANLNLDLDDSRKLRVGISQAISRPPLDELRAGEYISAISTGSSGGTGNPLLDPVTADQIDVAYEWYFAPESLLALSLYYKNIENYIGNATVGTFTTQQGTFEIYGPINGDGGYVRGAELTFQMPFDFLPVEGFGIYSNYAFAESNIYEFGPENNPLPMAGLAKDTATLDLWCSNYGIDARLGWKYHSAYTSAFTWDSYDLTTLDSELSLGFSLAYEINENYNVRFQAFNLTNEPLRLTQNNNSGNLKRFDDYGRTYLIDFTWKL